MLIGIEINNFPDKKPTIQIKRTWTDPEFRGKGFSPAMYDGLSKIGYRIISDDTVSPSALQVWKKLATKREIKGFDLRTNQYTDANPMSHPNISFVLEHEIISKGSSLVYRPRLWT